MAGLGAARRARFAEFGGGAHWVVDVTITVAVVVPVVFREVPFGVNFKIGGELFQTSHAVVVVVVVVVVAKYALHKAVATLHGLAAGTSLLIELQ